MTYIGIDISKSTFVAAFPSGSSYSTETYTNDTKGIVSSSASYLQTLIIA